MVYHLLGLSRSISSKTFSADPFTHNLLCIAKMLMSVEGNEVIHYGVEESEVECTEHVDVVTSAEMEESFGKDFRDQEFLYALGKKTYANDMFNVRAVHEVKKRANTGDFICCFAGNMHLPIINELNDLRLTVVEPAAGYSSIFCYNRVFASSAWMHFNYGQFHERWSKLSQEDKSDPKKWTAICNPYGYPKWQDEVISHPIDMKEFDLNVSKGDYLLNISRIVPVKGIEMAIKISGHLGIKLKIAGQGDFKSAMGFDPPNHVELLGVVGPEERSELMGNALAGLSLSLYPEPFGLTAIEFGACGTPVITTDWGAYKETVSDGLSGYRIKGFQKGIDAVKNIDKIKPLDCRKWVEDNFSIESLTDSYNSYFSSLLELKGSFEKGSGVYYLSDQ